MYVCMYVCMCVCVYYALVVYTVPESVYLLEKLERVIMNNNCIKELSSLIDTWEQLRTLDLTSNQLTGLHVRPSAGRGRAETW